MLRQFLSYTTSTWYIIFEYSNLNDIIMGRLLSAGGSLFPHWTTVMVKYSSGATRYSNLRVARRMKQSLFEGSRSRITLWQVPTRSPFKCFTIAWALVLRRSDETVSVSVLHQFRWSWIEGYGEQDFGAVQRSVWRGWVSISQWGAPKQSHFTNTSCIVNCDSQ